MSNSSRLSNDYFFSDDYDMVSDSVYKFGNNMALLKKRLSKLSGRDSGNVRKANELECAFIEQAKKLPEIIDSFKFVLLDAMEPEQFEKVKRLRDIFLTKIDSFESAYREKTRFFQDRFDPFVWAHIRNAREAADRLDFEEEQTNPEKSYAKTDDDEISGFHDSDTDDEDKVFSLLDDDEEDTDTDDGRFFSLDF